LASTGKLPDGDGDFLADFQDADADGSELGSVSGNVDEPNNDNGANEAPVADDDSEGEDGIPDEPIDVETPDEITDSPADDGTPANNPNVGDSNPVVQTGLNGMVGCSSGGRNSFTMLPLLILLSIVMLGPRQRRPQRVKIKKYRE